VRRNSGVDTDECGAIFEPISTGHTLNGVTKMEERDQAALAALPAILAYILNQRRPPVDAHEDDRWLQAFLEARNMSYEVGNHWAFRKDN